MAIADSILTARQRGADDEYILKQIETSNPKLSQNINIARNRGARATAILDDMLAKKGNALPEQKEGITSKIGEALVKVGDTEMAVVRGATKQVADVVAGASAMGERGLEAFNKAIGNKPTETIPLGQQIKESGKLTPEGLAEQFGYYGAELAELFAPIGKVPQAAGTAVKVATGALEQGAKTALQTGGDAKTTEAATVAGAVLPIVGKIAASPLEKMAKSLYLSALKPSTKLSQKIRDSLAQVGVDERVWLTEGGVKKVSDRIDQFEEILGNAIDEAKDKGIKISAAGMKAYVDETKKFFGMDIDVKAASKAVKELDSLYKNFIEKYGDELPIEEAQKLKVATGNLLKNQYQRLVSIHPTQAIIEGKKQAVRYLKDKIAEAAPVVKDINGRLKGLYELDKALAGASGRIGNLNLLGITAKIGLAASQGAAGKVISVAGELLDKASLKSGVAIGLNELSKIIKSGSANGQVPLNLLVRTVMDLLKKNTYE
jgi:hypothetical protein